jgi:hypothetical protein
VGTYDFVLVYIERFLMCATAAISAQKSATPCPAELARHELAWRLVELALVVGAVAARLVVAREREFGQFGQWVAGGWLDRPC